MADEQIQKEPPADVPPPEPEKPQSEAAKNRELHKQAEHEHREAAREARIARLKDLPPGVAVPNPTRAPSPVTHDRFAEEDEGAIGEP
jgi:hypothetical protein